MCYIIFLENLRGSYIIILNDFGRSDTYDRYCKQWSGKLDPKWKGPYHIHDIIGNGAYKIRELNGKVLKTPINGSLLKIYINRVDID